MVCHELVNVCVDDEVKPGGVGVVRVLEVVEVYFPQYGTGR